MVFGEWENGRMGKWENGRLGDWENEEKKSTFYLLITYYLNQGWGDGFWVENQEVLDTFKSIIIKDSLGITYYLLLNKVFLFLIRLVQ